MSYQPLLRNDMLPNYIFDLLQTKVIQPLFASITHVLSRGCSHIPHIIPYITQPVIQSSTIPTQTFAVTIPSSNLAYSIKLSSNIIGILPKDDPTSHPARIPIISVEPQQSAIDPLLFIVQLSGNNLNTENNTHLCLPTWLLPRQLDVFVQHPCIGWVTVSCSLMQRTWSNSSQFLPTKAHSTQYDQLLSTKAVYFHEDYDGRSWTTN